MRRSEMHGRGGGVAGAVARQPALAAAEHRFGDEVVLGERQHDVDPPAPRQHRLGDQDVGAAGERAERLARVERIERRCDARRERRLLGAVLFEHVAAVDDHRRRRGRHQSRRKVIEVTSSSAGSPCSSRVPRLTVLPHRASYM